MKLMSIYKSPGCFCGKKKKKKVGLIAYKLTEMNNINNNHSHLLAENGSNLELL